jgi:hypothetical protein
MTGRSTPLARDLIHEIAALADEKTRRDLGDLLFAKYDEYYKPNNAELETYLTGLRDTLQKDAKSRGYETDGQSQSVIRAQFRRPHSGVPPGRQSAAGRRDDRFR